MNIDNLNKKLLAFFRALCSLFLSLPPKRHYGMISKCMKLFLTIFAYEKSLKIKVMMEQTESEIDEDLLEIDREILL